MSIGERGYFAMQDEMDRLRGELKKADALMSEALDTAGKLRAENLELRMEVERKDAYRDVLHGRYTRLLEAARGLLGFIRGRFPADFEPGGNGFTCPHHVALAEAVAEAEGKP